MKQLLAILIASLVLGGCTPKGLFVKPDSGLEISSSPESTVFLNEENMGQTPYQNKNLKPGSYTIKLVPAQSGGDLLPYETKLTLVPGASTIIMRNLASTEFDTSGYTLQLQEDPSGQTFLSVISEPDTINVTLDDKPSGFTPLSKIETSPGQHFLQVSSPGYLPQDLSVNAIKGFNLIVNFKLASESITLTPPPVSTTSATLDPLSSPSPEASSDITPKPYVEIGETGTGWLRVRSEPSGTADELGKVDTGEQLRYLGESTELGWFKVEFEGQTGWVSGKYVTLVK